MDLDQITPLILTFDESANIGRTLNQLKWSSRVVIVDSFSTDETRAIAAGYPNVQVFQRAFDTHASQWNFGVDQTNTPWVLTLDADYLLTPELIEEIRMLNPPTEAVAYTARFHYCVWGKRLRSSIYPPRAVLFRRDKGRYYDEGHTQIWRTEGTVLNLSGYIDHDDRKPLSRWLASQDRYATIEARHLLAAPRKTLTRQDRLRLRIYVAPFVMPIYLLFVRRLIFDGWRGWFYVLQRTLAEALLSLRLLLERERLEPIDEKKK